MIDLILRLLNIKPQKLGIVPLPGVVVIVSGDQHIAITPGLADEVAKILPRYAETSRQRASENEDRKI